MKTFAALSAASLGALMLTGCIIVDDDGHPRVDSVTRNTDTAIRVCGEGNVEEVDDDGYTCKSDD